MTHYQESSDRDYLRRQELLLQKRHGCRGSFLVPNLLWLEYYIVCVQTHSARRPRRADMGHAVSLSTRIFCSGTPSGHCCL